MFANLKNKIREETGGDLPQLGPKHLGHGRLSRGSKGGSTSSMCSEQDNSMLKPKVDWQLQAETLLCEKAVLEEEKSDLVKKNLELAEQLKEASAFRQKAIQYQEDLDQLEGFQTQEIAKVKHLLLEREQQLSESQSSLGKAQTEISRLRSIQDQLAHLQEEKCSVSSLEAANARLEQLLAEAEAAAAELEQSRAAERRAAAALAEAHDAHQRLLGDKEDAGKRIEELEAEKKALDAGKKELEAERKALQAENVALKLCSQHVERVEADKKTLEAKCAQLEANQRNLQLEETLQSTISRLEGECSLLGERTREMEKQLAEANAEKDELQLRNASLSQQSELNCKELQEEISELKASLAKQAPKSQIDELNNKISDLEAQIAEKNKNNKVLTQRLADMKKTLQKEMKSTDAVVPPQQLQQQQQQPSADKMENNVDVNHEYLKHVVLKFFTSKEYEVAQHLIKAVATLLHFTPEEERLLRETLDWKMSWFGSKPKLAGNNSPRSFPPS
ncbi:Hypothetical predicted protein [Cloeon dipterum]|uniref:GRIP domain-containing protein n=1 Tax=Cloeon dipterum TaxID=197152 RepID=A0A8S1DLI0_9INSE|nr:Hypothetical predicted protein [Cloeon dipterum]